MRWGLFVCFIGKDKYFSFFSSRKFGNSEIKDQQPLHIQLLNRGTAALSLLGDRSFSCAEASLRNSLESDRAPSGQGERGAGSRIPPMPGEHHIDGSSMTALGVTRFKSQVSVSHPKPSTMIVLASSLDPSTCFHTQPWTRSKSLGLMEAMDTWLFGAWFNIHEVPRDSLLTALDYILVTVLTGAVATLVPGHCACFCHTKKWTKSLPKSFLALKGCDSVTLYYFQLLSDRLRAEADEVKLSCK